MSWAHVGLSPYPQPDFNEMEVQACKIKVGVTYRPASSLDWVTGGYQEAWYGKS